MAAVRRPESIRAEPLSQLRGSFPKILSEFSVVPTEPADDVDVSVSAVCPGDGQVDARGSRRLRVRSHPALVAQQQKSCQGETVVDSSGTYEL